MSIGKAYAGGPKECLCKVVSTSEVLLQGCYQTMWPSFSINHHVARIAIFSQPCLVGMWTLGLLRTSSVHRKKTSISLPDLSQNLLWFLLLLSVVDLEVDMDESLENSIFSGKEGNMSLDIVCKFSAQITGINHTHSLNLLGSNT